MNQRKVGRQVIRELKANGESPRVARQRHCRKVANALLSNLLDSGIPQTTIAKIVGVTQAAVSNNLHGETTASPNTIRRLINLTKAAGLEVPEVAEWRPL